jgi:hypothetical protein
MCLIIVDQPAQTIYHTHKTQHNVDTQRSELQGKALNSN